jgi:hypothetical protein
LDLFYRSTITHSCTISIDIELVQDASDSGQTNFLLDQPIRISLDQFIVQYGLQPRLLAQRGNRRLHHIGGLTQHNPQVVPRWRNIRAWWHRSIPEHVHCLVREHWRLWRRGEQRLGECGLMPEGALV